MIHYYFLEVQEMYCICIETIGVLLSFININPLVFLKPESEILHVSGKGTLQLLL